MRLKEAREIAGSLSKPSKMPGHGYGLPARECRTGTRLREVEGSVCHECYAMKGRYMFANVQRAQYYRWDALDDPRWTLAMITMIAATGDDYFRWQDSGDVRDHEHLAKIIEVCEALPHVSFWMPTRETRLIDTYPGEIPENLTIRRSMHMVGASPSQKGIDAGRLFSMVSDGEQEGAWNCPSLSQGNSCGDCRACWDPEVPVINYHVH